MEYISKIQIKPFKMKVIRNKTKFQILHKFSSFNSQNTHGFLKTKKKKKKTLPMDTNKQRIPRSNWILIQV